MEEKTCIDCGNTFTLSDEDVAFYSRTIVDKRRGSETEGQEIKMVLPKRCFNCRMEKRKQRSQG